MAILGARAFHHAERRALMRMAKDGKKREPVPMVDRIIPPFPADDVMTVDGKQLIQFEAVEINGLPPLSVVCEAE